VITFLQIIVGGIFLLICLFLLVGMIIGSIIQVCDRIKKGWAARPRRLT